MRTTNLAMKPIDCHSATGPNSITVPPISRPEGLLQGKGHGHSQVNGDGSAVEYCGLVLPPSTRPPPPADADRRLVHDATWHATHDSAGHAAGNAAGHTALDAALDATIVHISGARHRRLVGDCDRLGDRLPGGPLGHPAWVRGGAGSA